MYPVLKLNAIRQPLEIITFKKAMNLVIRGRAEILEEYDECFDTFKGVYQYPAVIRLLHFIQPSHKAVFAKPFTRRNILERDHYKCCYCDEPLSLSRMTYDHVIPRSEPYKGKTNWGNIVSCCYECNNKKSNRLPEEANMKLLRKPYTPIIADNFMKYKIEMLKEFSKAIASNKLWLSYWYYNIELEHDNSI